MSLKFGRNIDRNNLAEGNDVYLDCLIKANPAAYKVVWMHNGLKVNQRYSPRSRIKILSGGKNLVIQGVRRAHGGNYTCSAYNVEGEHTSNPVRLVVKCEF